MRPINEHQIGNVAMMVIAILAVGSRIGPSGAATFQAAAVRFEVRVAENAPATGLTEARVTGSQRLVYLHREVVVSNGDIARARVASGNDPSRFNVVFELTAAGA